MRPVFIRFVVVPLALAGAAISRPASAQYSVPDAQISDPMAQFDAGLAYEYGRGVAPDDEKAVAWFEKSAAQGYAPAETALGVAYAEGRGVEADDAKAAAWFAKAAAHGDPQAEFNLGLAYARGRGETQDYGQALAWFRKAADQGDLDAAAALGIAYARGHGVPEDDAAAYQWYAIAQSGAEAGSDTYRRATRALHILAERLTAAQISDAEANAAAWRAQHKAASP